MGPLYYAGSVAQLISCIEDVESLISPKFREYIATIRDVKANPGAGDPELSLRWNICMEAIRYMNEDYNGV